ncbi:AbrB/MazE/SpoVT family DNA-binding domain-containing protein [Candidatus Sumerlaeota bacterium]|nr:AbrB/MazE/SpoVT family DNA-binding domain-containing protein [Candidatus Sumerlaeota bacterium]
MRKKLATIGSSLGIIIDKPILDLLKITRETEIEIETDGDSLILRPVRFVPVTEGLRAYERVASRHRRSLEKLAK